MDSESKLLRKIAICSTESYAFQAVSEYMTKNQLSNSFLLTIIGKFQTESYKYSVVQKATLRIVPDLAEHFEKVIHCFTSDSYRMECILHLKKIECFPTNVEMLLLLMEKLRTSSYRQSLVEKFVKNESLSFTAEQSNSVLQKFKEDSYRYTVYEIMEPYINGYIEPPSLPDDAVDMDDIFDSGNRAFEFKNGELKFKGFTVTGQMISGGYKYVIRGERLEAFDPSGRRYDLPEGSYMEKNKHIFYGDGQGIPSSEDRSNNNNC
jgi:hypothetical protein